MTAAGAPPEGLDARKAAIRGVLGDLAALAGRRGSLSSSATCVTRGCRSWTTSGSPSSVLGEFNHGKSTFINALLGAPVLPTGITPTTAVLAHVIHGARAGATLVGEDGARKTIAVGALADWLTVEGAANQAGGQGAKDGKGATPPATTFHHVELTQPVALLENQLTIVDTPGVNDINEQRAEITYGYLPRADAAVFLLDATQILTASERQFLEERILRSTRDRLLFVVAKTDLLDEGELAETLAFAKKHLAAIVPEPAIFPVSAKRALAGDRAGSGMDAFVAALGSTVAHQRRRLLLDHALADAGRLSAFVRQSLAIHRRSLELPLPELEQRIGRAHERLRSGKKVLETAAATVRAETAGLKARVRQDLADFTAQLRTAVGGRHRRRRRRRHPPLPVVLRAGHLEGLDRGGGGADLRRARESRRDGDPGGERKHP